MRSSMIATLRELVAAFKANRTHRRAERRLADLGPIEMLDRLRERAAAEPDHAYIRPTGLGAREREGVRYWPARSLGGVARKA